MSKVSDSLGSKVKNEILVDNFGQTSLHWAVHEAKNKNNNYKSVIEMLRYLSLDAILQPASGNNNYTALHLAVHTGDIELVKLIIEELTDRSKKSNSKDVKEKILNFFGAQDDYGQTALHWAVDGKKAIVENLIKVMTEDQIAYKASGKHNYTALHMAINTNNFDIAKILIDLKNKNLIKAVDEFGQTALPGQLEKVMLN